MSVTMKSRNVLLCVVSIELEALLSIGCVIILSHP